MKTTVINIRVTPDQKDVISKMAEEKGFSSSSAMVLWLIAYAKRHPELF
jgi:uncharacterized protein (DUF1778 family)